MVIHVRTCTRIAMGYVHIYSTNTRKGQTNQSVRLLLLLLFKKSRGLGVTANA